MSHARSFANGILGIVKAKLQTETGVARNLLFSLSSTHFVQGLLIERTAYRNSVYAWNVVCPLFRPTRNISLNYSLRILNSHLFQGSKEEVAEAIMDSANMPSGLDLSLFSQERTMEIFLRDRLSRCDWMKHPIVPEIFDFGVLFLARKDYERARMCFERCISWLADNHTSQIWKASTDLVALIDMGGTGVHSFVEDLEMQTRRALGLAI